MKTICVGIYVSAEPERLRETLLSLRANTSQPVELLLLLDGLKLDDAVRSLLPSLDDQQLSGTSEARGTAACFNRLAAHNQADLVVLLESGAQVAPGWLDQLLAALDSNPRHGLAGPSTNSSWNEQGVYQHSAADQIAATASDAAKRFGSDVRTLEPLYSLADFCYVVRREVIAAVGAADESYRLGPCWEMDYNIRAARAGWRGVWACAAYVHRAPVSSHRRLTEARDFAASKRRYQDKFCGARLRGQKTDYREHCRGDACPNFAPSTLIQVRQPWPSATAEPEPNPDKPAVSRRDSLPVTIESEPLVSCIMPTSDRRSFVPQAIRCFLRQSYPNLELVIVDDGADPVIDCVPENDRIRYLQLDHKLKIGAKRNFACEQARGDFIVHWDDDDWYPDWRVRAQMNGLQSGSDLCGSSRVFYYDPAKDQSWEYRYAASGPRWIAGNTLAYRRSLWQSSRFPDLQIGEDSRFVWDNAGKSICDLADPALCVGTVHEHNTSRKDVNGAFWHLQGNERLYALLGDDRYFYFAASQTQQPAWPLVSCIMPTYNRRQFVPQALQSFRQQDYPNRELIIIDDGSDGIGDLIQDVPGVCYQRLPARMSIGAKRNLACQHARGEIIAHWDDDDWYSSDRLRYQVAPIIAGAADLTGLENAFVLELPGGEFWTTKPELHRKLFVGNVHGGTLVFRKDLLANGLRYPEINLAEDAYLLHGAVTQGKRLLRLANPGVFVYVRHGHNAWKDFRPGQSLNPAGWERIPAPLTFPMAALTFYKSASKAGSFS
jgi:glycosyltransferase involved in cell wall biosynthesis